MPAEIGSFLKATLMTLIDCEMSLEMYLQAHFLLSFFAKAPVSGRSTQK